jgi:hypothetical protein
MATVAAGPSVSKPHIGGSSCTRYAGGRQAPRAAGSSGSKTGMNAGVFEVIVADALRSGLSVDPAPVPQSHREQALRRRAACGARCSSCNASRTPEQPAHAPVAVGLRPVGLRLRQDVAPTTTCPPHQWRGCHVGAARMAVSSLVSALHRSPVKVRSLTGISDAEDDAGSPGLLDAVGAASAVVAASGGAHHGGRQRTRSFPPGSRVTGRATGGLVPEGCLGPARTGRRDEGGSRERFPSLAGACSSLTPRPDGLVAPSVRRVERGEIPDHGSCARVLTPGGPPHGWPTAAQEAYRP